MAPKSPFVCFQGHLQQLLTETPGRTYTDFLNLYLKFKEITNVEEVVDKKYDFPKLTKDDLHGYEAKKRKQKNKLYTWIKNQCFKPTDGIKNDFSQLKDDWKMFADANPMVVLDYIRHRPILLSNLKEAFVPVVVLTDIHRSGSKSSVQISRDVNSSVITKGKRKALCKRTELADLLESKKVKVKRA